MFFTPKPKTQFSYKMISLFAFCERLHRLKTMALMKHTRFPSYIAVSETHFLPRCVATKVSKPARSRNRAVTTPLLIA